jgi:hypothetical protein
METEIITIYVICDEFLGAINHNEDNQIEMSDAEVMTTALVAMLKYGGNYAQARRQLADQGYIPNMLSESRFSRRLNRIGHLFVPLFALLANTWKSLNPDHIYAIDTFPLPVCDNIRISRARIYQTEQYRGYIASKRRYFYGLKIYILVTQTGQPVEFFFSPGGDSDVAHEDCLAEDGQIDLSPYRKKNSKRPVPPWIRFLQQRFRKIVETSASLVERLLPKHIHATNTAGFELKVILFIVAFSFDRLLSA